MPAAHDIYTEQLRELRRGQPLYYPEPSFEDGPVEIGDVGYTRQGAFCKLFNVAKAANDPSQSLGVPEGFQVLDIGRILSYDAALEPGPLHSKTVFRMSANAGTNAAVVLPADASFQFSCSSARGAILMLESQMSRQQVFHDNRVKNYLLQHCLSWYEFARNLGVQVDFGDIMVVTECSKTSAWASAVYSQSSRDFGMSFSAGGMFIPSPSGEIAFSVGLERIGPVEHRRSQRKAINQEEMLHAPKDQTVFVRGYRLGSRSLYMRSLARKIIKTTNLGRQGSDGQPQRQMPSAWSPPNLNASRQSSSQPTSPTIQPSRSSRLSDFEVPVSANASAIAPEYQDYHPAVALLAHTMETTAVQIAVVHDDDWCSAYSEVTNSIIDEYAKAFFEERWRKRSVYKQNFGNSLLSLISIAKSDIDANVAQVTGQGTAGDVFTATLQFSDVTLLRDLPPMLERPSLRARSKSEPIPEHQLEDIEFGRSKSAMQRQVGDDTKPRNAKITGVTSEERREIASMPRKSAKRSAKCIIM